MFVVLRCRDIARDHQAERQTENIVYIGTSSCRPCFSDDRIVRSYETAIMVKEHFPLEFLAFCLCAALSFLLHVIDERDVTCGIVMTCQ